jgi:branched-chain amino acid aminotransferase
MNIFPDGEGFFETIQTHNQRPVAIGAHLARARSSAQRLGVILPTDAEINVLVLKALDSGQPSEFGRLRIVFSMRGQVEITHEKYEMRSTPARVCVVTDPIERNSQTIGIKSLPYTANLFLLTTARDQGCDEVIRIDSEGHVSEGAVSNVVFRINGQWMTPALTSGCLPGIVRAVCIAELGVQEAVLLKEDIERADAGFLLSSLKLAQPISHIGDRKLEIVRDFAEQVSKCMAEL